MIEAIAETLTDPRQPRKIQKEVVSVDGKSICGSADDTHRALHWRLDVGFRKDACRIRKDHSGENFATIRKTTMNFLRKKDETQLSLRGKRHRCACDNEYLLRVLSGV